jgi:hypothetical protein
LFGNVAAETLAMALAFKIAKGFLPVRLVYPCEPDFPFYAVSDEPILPADLAPAP